MTILDTVANKLNNGEAVNAVQYVRLEHFSEKTRDKIVANHGTKRCKNFLAEHPNIKLVETPYIDSIFSLRDDADREELVKMCVRLADKDVNLVLVDDIYELASSFDDAIVTENLLFGWHDVAVLDMKNGMLCDSVEGLINYILSGEWAEQNM